MFTAPPNRYTNTTISITGSSSAVSSASGLRSDRRRLRPAMISASDMSGLRGGCGKGEEDVVEGGAAHREPGHQVPARVGLDKQRADLSRAAVGGHTDGPRGRVQV